MSYSDLSKKEYEDRILHEVGIIVSIIIIGVCVLVFFIKSTFISNDRAVSDTEAAGQIISDPDNLINVEKYTDSDMDAGEGIVDETSEAVELYEETSSFQVNNQYAESTMTNSETNHSDRVSVSGNVASPEVITINPIAGMSAPIAGAEIETYTGNISYEDQEEIYSFVATFDGYYRIALSQMMSGNSVSLYLYDDLWNVVSSNSYCYNDDGLTGRELLAGKTYYVKVKQSSGYTGYILSIYKQKAPVNISGFTEIADSIEFEDQRNYYVFCPAVDGRYRFELSNVYSGKSMNIRLCNSLGEDLKSNSYCYNGDGITVKDLKAGEAYLLIIRQGSGYSTYTLNIGYQKSVTDVSGYRMINDCIEYTDQCNIYSFTPNRSGDLEITLFGTQAGTSMTIKVLNDLDEVLKSTTLYSNGDTCTLKDIDLGTHYRIMVIQSSGRSEYTINLNII